jgi:RNA polymerase sigma-70 factor (ECF subfamily)
MATAPEFHRPTGEPFRLHRVPGANDADVIAASMTDPTMFGELFDRHWVAVHAFCIRRAGTDGEDVAAEVFRLAFEGRDRYDDHFPNARPWLFGIAMNSLRLHFRSKQRRERGTERMRSLLGRRSDEMAASELLPASIEPELARALSGLSAVELDALLLFAWEELEYAEIATVLGVPLGTVRSRIHRARQHLRVILSERNQDE